MQSESTPPRFRPDPSYRLTEEESRQLARWVNRPAAERILSALPTESRNALLRLLGPAPTDTENHYTLPTFSESADPEWDQAIWDLFTDLRALGFDDDVPFPNPASRTS
jgi:hypothetical protein